MRISSKYIQKLIAESLDKNLILERKSDMYYDIINKNLLSVFKDPERYLIPLGWYDANEKGDYGSGSFIEIPGQSHVDPNGLRMKKTRGSLVRVRDQIKYFDYLNQLEDYYAFMNKVTPISALNRIKPVYDKLKSGGKELSDHFGFYYAIKSEEVENLANKTYNQINDDKFLDKLGITIIFENLLIKCLPDMGGNSGGSMDASGNLKINCYHDDLTYAQALNSLPSLGPVFGNNPFDSRHEKNISDDDLIKAAMNDSSFLPYFHNKEPELKIQLVKKRINKYKKNKLDDREITGMIDALNWANCTEKEFNKLLKINNQIFETLIYHEITHFINAVRARFKNKYKKKIHYRDSGLAGIKKRTGGQRGVGSAKYTLSTEELSARYHELRYLVEKSLNIVYDSFKEFFIDNPFDKKIPDDLTKRQDIFLKLLNREKNKPTRSEPASDLWHTVNDLLLNKKSKAVNDLVTLKGTAQRPSGEIRDSYVVPTWISATIFATYGPKETWKTKEGKERIGRVYNRVIELVELMDSWLKKHNLK